MMEGHTVGTSPLCAQPPDAYNHDGFYFRFSTGFGYARFSGTGPNGNVSIYDAATLGTIALGGTIAPGLVLAGSLGAVSITETTLRGAPGSPGVDASQVHIAALLDWFPKPSDGWHVGATLGFGGASMKGANADGTGATVVAGLFGGYDWWIGPQWSLGSALWVSGTPSAALKNSHGDNTGYNLGSGSIMFMGSLLLH